MPQTRVKVSFIMEAVLNILNDKMSIPVGDGGKPDNCNPPYLVVSNVVSGGADGPIDDPEADAATRIQIQSVADTRFSADKIRDQVRDYLKTQPISDELNSIGSGRRCQYAWIDVTTGSRDERGLPEPIFSAIDQYAIRTTPG